MVFPFFIYGAIFIIVPIAALGIGILSAAATMGMAVVVLFGILNGLKWLARLIPGIRDLMPAEELSAEESSEQRAAADEFANEVAAAIEAEIEEAERSERENLRPKTLEEASLLLEEAKTEADDAAAAFEDAQKMAKAQSGQWMAVAEARQRLSEVNERLEQARQWAEPLMLEETPSARQSEHAEDAEQLFVDKVEERSPLSAPSPAPAAASVHPGLRPQVQPRMQMASQRSFSSVAQLNALRTSTPTEAAIPWKPPLAITRRQTALNALRGVLRRR
eukprot:TRINITY_DN55371_c0_g1_i1.p1 TRINITY_DN55371_c0_g1~~TRINITY_DN55371_c0_g1_i1.p1  ORF type:complete len:277 (-),score=86.49 TRINITY_DN55371_c0_g1_i1:309-1139(-)